MHDDACLSVKEVSSRTGTHPCPINIQSSSNRRFINEGGKISKIIKQCFAKWNRNGLLGILLVICSLAVAYAQAGSGVTMSVSLRLFHCLSNYAPQY